MKQTIAGLLAFTLLAAAARPQEAIPQEPPSQEDLQQQLIDLIHKVERRLAAIDTKLSDAGAGVLPLEDVDDSGLDDLLRQAQNQSRQNVEDIDRILEIASQMNSQSQGSQSQKPQNQPSESPLDQERDRGPQERENTPSEPHQEQDQKQQGEEDQPEPSENPRDGENREGDVRPDASGSGPSSADDAKRWGELPVRYREVFRNQGGEELPVQYRDWIDAYHRRLSKSRR